MNIFCSLFSYLLHKVLCFLLAFLHLQINSFYILFNSLVTVTSTLNTNARCTERANPTGTPRRIDADITSIRQKPNFGQFPSHFHVLSRCNLGDRENPRFFPRAFFDVISLVEKFKLFPRTFCDVILLVEIATYFSRAFLLVDKSMLFPRTFLNLILMDEKSTLFARIFFDKISMDQILMSFLVSCKLIKTFEEVFLC